MEGSKDCVISGPLETRREWLGSKGGIKIVSFDLVILIIGRILETSSFRSDGR